MHELQAMKDLIEDRFNTLTWLGQARQNPIQSNLMLKMIRAGYSPALARTILERMPEELGAAESVRWLMEVLERNLQNRRQHAAPCTKQGGIYALVGSTGVGKTTTTAKLAGAVRPHPRPRQRGPDHAGHLPRRRTRAIAQLRPHAGRRGAPGA
ncbi:MAG: hypothetical protein V9G23_15655 [Giesbergeria sp.]